MQMLSIFEEYKMVKKAFEANRKIRSNACVQLKLFHGTKENLYKALKENPTILHLSMHGETDYLELDNGFGKNDKLKVFDERLKKEMNSVKVVLFLACKSQNIALNLFERGNHNLKHVIYIDQKSKVEDEACVVFSQEFYGKLYGYINSSEKFNCNVC